VTHAPGPIASRHRERVTCARKTVLQNFVSAGLVAESAAAAAAAIEQKMIAAGASAPALYGVQQHDAVLAVTQEH